jgi:multiple sugar transport system ATP-binding protein
MATVRLDGVSKTYGKVLAVDKISVEVKDGEFLALLGPSGCGKSSTMRMIAGLEAISSGVIYIDGRAVNELAPAARHTAMSFENYGLYPHMTVFQNIAYPLRIRGTPSPKVAAEVVKIARLLQIEGLLDAKPNEVSGGVQQRVSLARALVRRPSVFLLDEPLSHLDADLRSQMRGELKRLQKIGDGSTMVYVTHDQLEAMTMADRIAVMHQGRLQQVGEPKEIYDRPANQFVASFIGEPAMNLLSGELRPTADGAAVEVDGTPVVQLTGATAIRLLEAAREGGSAIQLGVRPHHIEVSPAGRPGLPGSVRTRELLGQRVLLTVEAGDRRVRIVGPRSELSYAEGEGVRLRFSPERGHFFSATTGEAIRSSDVAVVH